MNDLKDICELNGYLKLLQRLCRRKCHFSASVIDIENGLENSLKTYLSKFGEDVIFTDLRQASFDDFKTFLDRFIYSNLVHRDSDFIKIIEWDIVEYFGLALADIASEDDFNPLVSNGGWQVDIKSSMHDESQFFLLPFDNQAILLTFGVR